MAVSEEETTILNTPFLNPPSFWESFTTENLEAYRVLKAEANGSSLAVPKHLEGLQPPTPPENGEYATFGEKRSVSLVI